MIGGPELILIFGVALVFFGYGLVSTILHHKHKVAGITKRVSLNGGKAAKEVPSKQ